MSDKKTETLLTRAMDNYNAACVLFEADKGEDKFSNIIGFHLQQAVEFSMKHQLKQEGIGYEDGNDNKYEHDLHVLVNKYFRKNNIKPCITDYVMEFADMFSAWEVNVNNPDYRVGYERIIRAFPEVKKSIDNTRKLYI